MDLQEIAQAVVMGKATLVKNLVEEALNEGTPPSDILFHGLVAGMDIVSKRFSKEEFYVPDVLIASRAVHAGMRVVRPLLLESVVPLPGKLVIGTVAGDLHDIGKSLVTAFVKARGFEVVDLGIDVHPEEFVEAVLEHRPEVLGMSALLTTTMPMMASTVRLLEKSGLRERIKIIVGGGPVTHDYSKSIDADGYAIDARSAAELVGKCVQELEEEKAIIV